MLIYIAAPLFCYAERNFNLEIRSFLISIGFNTYLPQLDGGVLSDMLQQGYDIHTAKHILFEKDLDAINNSQAILFLLDGRVPDEGACIEVGIGFALNKACFGFKTDSRSFIAGEDNLMITEILKGRIAHSFEELASLLIDLRK